MMATVAVVILAAAFMLQAVERKIPSIRRGFFGIPLFTLSIIIMGVYGIFQSWQIYQSWITNEFAQLLLPPHQDFSYFVFYARTRIFNPYLLSLVVAMFLAGIAKYGNKKFDGRFFEREESYLMATALFLSGHPGWFLYLLILFSVFFAITAGVTLYHFLFSHRETPRISLYYLWLPVALFTILISKWLAAMPWWQLLKL